LALRKIIEIVATRCCILRLQCTKFDFLWDPAGGAYSAPPDPIARFKGAYFLVLGAASLVREKCDVL